VSIIGDGAFDYRLGPRRERHEQEQRQGSKHGISFGPRRRRLNSRLAERIDPKTRKG
jgi:hypothetical protein